MFGRIRRWWKHRKYQKYREGIMGVVAWDGNKWTVYNIKFIGCEYPETDGKDLVFRPLVEQEGGCDGV